MTIPTGCPLSDPGPPKSISSPRTRPTSNIRRLRLTQNETLGHRGRKNDPLYRIRRLLTAASERINDRGRTRLRGLLDAGDPHGEVRTAWHGKETVRSIYDIDSPAVALRYTLQLAGDLQDESCPPEINRLGRTIARWTLQIANWHISKVTNGPTEALSNQIKRVQGQRSGSVTSRTTESEHSSTRGNPTGTYSHRSLPREIRRAGKGAMVCGLLTYTALR